MIGTDGMICENMVDAFVDYISQCDFLFSEYDLTDLSNKIYSIFCRERQNMLGCPMLLYLWLMSDTNIVPMPFKKFDLELKDGNILFQDEPIGLYGNELIVIEKTTRNDDLWFTKGIYPKGRRLWHNTDN